MSYIGKIPATGNFVKLDAITCSSTNTYNLLQDSVAFTPESANHMLVSLNGVIQAPITAFTVSGSTITFIPASGTLSSSDSIDFIMVYGNVLDIGTPSDNTVSASKLTTDSVQTAKIVDDAVTKAKVNFISDATAGVEVKGDGGSNDGYIQLNCSQNSHGIKLKSPPHSANASYTLTFPNNDGNANEFLQTNGSGVMTWAEAGGGEWTKILHTTASNVSTVEFNSTYLTSTYQDYKIVYSNVHCVDDAQRFFLEVSADNGSSPKNLDQNVLGRKDDGNSIHGRYYNGSQQNLQLHNNEDIGNDAGLQISGEIDIFDPSGTDNRKLILGRSGSNVGDSAFAFFYSIFGAMSQDTNAINHVKFVWGSGNIASGEFTLYGRKIT